MKLNIRGDKIEVTEAIKNQVMDKIKKLDNYFENPNEITAHILIRVNGLNQTIEVTIPTQKFTLRAEETMEDLYAAINVV